MNMVITVKNFLFRPPPKTNKEVSYRVHLSLGYLLGWEGGSHGGASGMPLGVRCDWGGGSEADALENMSHIVRML